MASERRASSKMIGIIVIALVIGAAVGYAGGLYSAPAIQPVRQTVTDDEGQVEEMAISFLKSSPTFAFDGIEDSIEVGPIVSTRDYPPSLFRLTINFTCTHSGYGDRTGQALTQVLTDHEIDIAIKRKDRSSDEFEIISAEIDNLWDELNQVKIIHGAEMLLGKQWVLQSFTDKGQQVSFPANTEITIQFSKDGDTRGTGVCNQYFVRYEISEGKKISFGTIASTEMACPEGMEQETQYFAALEKITTFQVTTNNLKLSSEDAQTIMNFAVLTQ